MKDRRSSPALRIPEARSIRIGELRVDRYSRAAAVAIITDWLDATDRCRLVYTPNLDHLAVGEHDAEFRAAYASADLSVADGQPLLWLAKLAGSYLPERVNGTNLVNELLPVAAARRRAVMIVGGKPDIVERAVAAARLGHPSLSITGLSPPFPFPAQADDERAVLEEIDRVRPSLLLVCLGAPKSEKWLARVRGDLPPGVAIAAGATVDYLAGSSRAPAWMQDHGLEWAFRLAVEPARLLPRYLGRDLPFLAQEARRVARPIRPNRHE